MGLSFVDLNDVVKQHFYEVALTVLLLVVFFWLFSFILRRHRLYSAFKNISCDPEQHYLFGHAPEYVIKVASELVHWLWQSRKPTPFSQQQDVLLQPGLWERDWFSRLIAGVIELLKDMGVALDVISGMMFKNNWKILKVRYGPGMYQLVTMHPDLSRTVLKSAPKSDEVYYPLLPWLGRGLLTANGPKWQQARRLLTPAFHYDILRPYIKVYTEAAGELVDLWSRIPEGESFDAFPYISLLTLDVMLRCTCSHRSNCQLSKSHNVYISAVYELSNLSNKRIMSLHQYFDLIYYLCPDYWRFKHLCSVVHKFSMDIIKQRRVELTEGKKARGGPPRRKYLDFIDILLEAKDQNGKAMTDMEIRAEVDTFMFEGHDTTASGITWTLYNLALHPEHQEICRREVDAIFEQKDDIDVEDLKSLVHLKYCLKESMRLFPPVAATGRVLDAPLEIDGHVMPQGTAVVHCTYGVHRHPDFWENPNDFDPLRFTPEKSKGRHSHAFVPFSAGPRNCIGQEFALNEERVVLSHILRHFELSLDETKLPIKKDFLIILRPKGGLHLKLSRRAV